MVGISKKSKLYKNKSTLRSGYDNILFMLRSVDNEINVRALLKVSQLSTQQTEGREK